MDAILELERVLILLLLLISFTTWIGYRIRLPYTVPVVLAGLILSLVPGINVELPETLSEVILAVFLPPVVYEAGLQLDWPHLRRNLPLVLTLTVPGVLLSALLIGGTLHLALGGISLATAIVFGALISAVDPIAVVALFKALPVPERLHTLIESESLLNDGTSIVVFHIALGVAAGGSFHLLEGIGEFLLVAVGGVAVGVALAAVVGFILRYIDNYLVEMTYTACLAYGAYLVAEELHVSGVLAVVAAGVLTGRRGMGNMSEETLQVVDTIWEYLAYIANAAIFLLIGLSIHLRELFEDPREVGLAIGLVLAARALLTYGLVHLPTLLSGQAGVPRSWKHVLFWGGQRGGVSLALALSLPFALDARETIQHMTFGVVLFSAFIQAATMPDLLERLSLKPDMERQPEQPEHESEHEPEHDP